MRLAEQLGKRFAIAKQLKADAPQSPEYLGPSKNEFDPSTWLIFVTLCLCVRCWDITVLQSTRSRIVKSGSGMSDSLDLVQMRRHGFDPAGLL